MQLIYQQCQKSVCSCGLYIFAPPYPFKLIISKLIIKNPVYEIIELSDDEKELLPIKQEVVE